MAREREALEGDTNQDSGAFTDDKEELEILVKFMNEHLALVDEGKLTHGMPLSHEDDAIFESLSDGITICHLFNQLIPEQLDESAISIDKTENWNLCINACNASGCRMTDINVEELEVGNPEHIQKVIFQIIKLGLETDVKLQEDYIKSLLPDDDVIEWSIDKLLLTWVNTIVDQHGHSRHSTSVTKDFKDSFFYMVLLDHITGSGVDLLDEEDNELKAMDVSDKSKDLGKGAVITINGILEGTYWQNFIFLASLFLTAAAK